MSAEPETAQDPAASSPLVPAAWCRRLLTSLSKRKLSDRESGNLEMLLTFFIEVNPPADAFAGLLSSYVDGRRADLSEAARLLQRAWEAGHDEQAPAAPPLPEILRTLGARLDDASAHAAYLVVAPERAQIQTFGDPSNASLDAAELRLEIASRVALRGQVAPAEPGLPPSFETRLRRIGDRLQQEPAQTYELFLTPRTIVVKGSAGYYRSCTLDELFAPLQPTSPSPDAPAAPTDLLAATGDRQPRRPAKAGSRRRR